MANGFPVNNKRTLITKFAKPWNTSIVRECLTVSSGRGSIKGNEAFFWQGTKVSKGLGHTYWFLCQISKVEQPPQCERQTFVLILHFLWNKWLSVSREF